MTTKTSTRKKAGRKPATRRTTAKTVAKTPSTGARKTKTTASKSRKPVAKATKTAVTKAKKPATTRARKADRDIEKGYTHKQFVAKLRRLADSIEKGKNFQIMVAGEKIYVPDAAIFNVEHEREKGAEELEFQIKWKKAA